ncbi:uncharacterized protein [Diabrotica undecimpunctata]|uniref:uncharacterized protein isoform X3 n=1 Tax=Diabrotica undecimpunctata TaxID=50387 RepID=UPI003B640875
MEYNEDFKDFRNQQVLKFRIDEIDSFKENENLQIKSEIVDCNFKSNIVDEGHLLAESSSQYIKLETPIVKEETRKASCIINIQDVKLKIKKKLGEFTSTANKLDLRTDPEAIKTLGDKNLHPVSQEEGERMAKKIKAIKYMECSAKHLFGIKPIFEEAARIALETKTKSKMKHCKFL